MHVRKVLSQIYQANQGQHFLSRLDFDLEETQYKKNTIKAESVVIGKPVRPAQANLG